MLGAVEFLVVLSRPSLTNLQVAVAPVLFVAQLPTGPKVRSCCGKQTANWLLAPQVKIPLQTEQVGTIKLLSAATSEFLLRKRKG